MNKKIVIAGVIIIGSGIINAMLKGGKMTPIFIGGFIFIILMSILDFFGGPLSQFASALSMIAVLVCLLGSKNHKPFFPWDVILGALGAKGGTGTTKAG